MTLLNSESRGYLIGDYKGGNQAVHQRINHTGHGVGQFLRFGSREIEFPGMSIFVTGPAANGAKTLERRWQIQGLDFLVQPCFGEVARVTAAVTKVVDDSFKTDTEKGAGRSRRGVDDGLSFAKYGCSFGRHVLGRVQAAVYRPNQLTVSPEAEFVAAGVKTTGYGVFVGVCQHKKIVGGNRHDRTRKVAGSPLESHISPELHWGPKEREG